MYCKIEPNIPLENKIVFHVYCKEGVDSMFTFRFRFKDGTTKIFPHINEVHYIKNGQKIIVSGDDILNHPFPFNCNMTLGSNSTNPNPARKEIIYISVTKDR